MTIRAGPVPHGGGRATAAAPDRSRADAVLAVVAIVLLMQVWRVQELFPILAVPGLPIVATLGAGLLFFLGRNSGRALGGLDRPLVAAVLGILVLVALSIPGSLYPRYGFEFLLKDYLRTVVLMLLVAASVRGLADLRRLVWLQVVGVTLFSAVMLTRGSVASDGRLSETAYYDVNDLATLIVCSLPLALHLWRWSGVWARLALLAILECLMVPLVKTGSRGGFLGFVAVAVYLLLWFDGVAPAKRWAAVALPVLMLVALGGGGYFERMQTLLHPDSDYNWSGNSETGRMEVWKRGIGYMLDRPLLGVGAQAFGVAEGTLAPEAVEREEYGKGFKWSTAHNAFVEIGAEIGVLGLLLFVALLVGAFRVRARARWPRQTRPGEAARAHAGVDVPQYRAGAVASLRRSVAALAAAIVRAPTGAAAPHPRRRPARGRPGARSTESPPPGCDHVRRCIPGSDCHGCRGADEARATGDSVRRAGVRRWGAFLVGCGGASRRRGCGSGVAGPCTARAGGQRRSGPRVGGGAPAAARPGAGVGAGGGGAGAAPSHTPSRNYPGLSHVGAAQPL